MNDTFHPFRYSETVTVHACPTCRQSLLKPAIPEPRPRRGKSISKKTSKRLSSTFFCYVCKKNVSKFITCSWNVPHVVIASVYSVPLMRSRP